MTKREYAEAIAEIIGGEVYEVEKANGVITTGITKRIEGMNIAPTIYIDSAYAMEKSVEESAKKIGEMMEAYQPKENMDLSCLLDYENVKDRLRARLYNKATKADIFRSAEVYGFDDLVIIPYIEVTDFMKDGWIKVSESLFNHWGVSEKEVIDTAMMNTDENIEIMSMAEIMANMLREQGAPENLIEQMVGSTDNAMYVVSNKKRFYGAIGVILKADELRMMFPDGYTVLPSSVHEIIVVPNTLATDPEYLAQMVREVNATEVDELERLGNKPYPIAA